MMGHFECGNEECRRKKRRKIYWLLQRLTVYENTLHHGHEYSGKFTYNAYLLLTLKLARSF